MGGIIFYMSPVNKFFLKTIVWISLLFMSVVPIDVYSQSVGPGGVTANLQWWLKADYGTTGNPVSSWTNRANLSQSAYQAISSRWPNYLANEINNNPALEFISANTHFFVISAGQLHSSGDYAQFAVTERTNNSAAITSGQLRRGFDALRFEYNTSRAWVNPWGSGGLNISVNNHDNPAETPALLFQELNTVVGRVIREFRDGDKTENTNSTTTTLTSNAASRLIFMNFGSAMGNQKMAEMIFYDNDLTLNEERRVQTYLALKYGLTLDHDYLSSSSVNLFDVDGTHVSYKNDIAGIGQDDSSELDQTTSRSEHVDSVVKISSASSQDNGDFLVWGNDNGSLSETSLNVPSGVLQRLERIWRMNETGDIGMVTVDFDISGLSVTGVSASDFTLIQDSNTTFSSGTVTTVADSFSSDIVTFTGVDPTDGDYFTLGTEVGGGGGGSLAVDIVNTNGVPVVTPSVQFSEIDFSFDAIQTTAYLGTTSEQIRVTNGTGNASWTLSLAASSPTDLFTGSNTGARFDFNDSSFTVDGSDSDSVAGMLRIYPSNTGIITPQTGCSTSGVSLGATADFLEGTVDSVTLANASSTANTNCFWNITQILAHSRIPPEQPADIYTIDFTVSIVAS